MSVITHTYDSYEHATQAVAALERAGVPHSDITIVSGDQSQRTNDIADTLVGSHDEKAMAKLDAAGTGATIGTVLGGGAGLLAGLGALAIPGFGPLIAAGWLVSAITTAGLGAAAGGLASSLMASGLTEEEAHRHSEHVGRGGTMVSARVDDAMDETARSILNGGSAGTTGYRDMATDHATFDHAATNGRDAARGTVENNPVTRTVDETLGTNVSGEHPEHADGTRANPPGTMASRGVDHALGTNVSGDNPERRVG